MSRHVITAFVLAGVGAFAGTTLAQPAQPPFQAGIGGLSMLRTDLDNNGGDASFNALFVSASWNVPSAGPWSGGLSFRYSYLDWSFSNPNALAGNRDPWGSIQSPSVGFNVGYRFSERVFAFVSPQLEWSYEDGASASDGESYGAVFAVSRVFSPTLTLGVGGGVFRRIDTTKFFPIVYVNWQIDDRWRLSNALQAGPTGGPGLELAYKLNERWDVSGDIAFRDLRFRLRDDGPVRNGIGVDKGIPLYVRLTYKPTAHGRIDFYAGAIVNGELRVLNSNGSTVTSSDYDAAPILGISGSLRF
jgi:hypothetical protein